MQIVQSRVEGARRRRRPAASADDEDDDVFLCADDEADSCCDVLNSAEFDADSHQQTVFSPEDFYAKLSGKASGAPATKSLSETHLKRNNFSALNLVNAFERSHSLSDTLTNAVAAASTYQPLRASASDAYKRNSAPVSCSCSCSCSNINANASNGVGGEGRSALSKKPVDSGYVSDNKASSTRSLAAAVHEATQED
jgi:hypothetical protein